MLPTRNFFKLWCYGWARANSGCRCSLRSRSVLQLQRRQGQVRHELVRQCQCELRYSVGFRSEVSLLSQKVSSRIPFVFSELTKLNGSIHRAFSRSHLLLFAKQDTFYCRSHKFLSLGGQIIANYLNEYLLCPR